MVGRCTGAKEMNEKQEQFLIAYLRTNNATKAAEEVGYKQPHVAGPRLLEHVEIKEALTAARVAKMVKFHVETDRVLQEMAAVGLSDIRELLTQAAEGGDITLRNLDEWPESAARAVSSFKVKRTIRRTDDGQEVEDITHEVRLWPKTSALEQLGKHLGLFEKDNLQRSAIFAGIPRELAEELLGHINSLAKLGRDRSVVAEVPAKPAGRVIG
jgi:phage terminase small subunit